MHYTDGDGAFSDPIAGHKVFADEDPPTRDATQLRFQEANTYQEEMANVIIGAGMTLNADSESIAQMVQLRDAINTLITNSKSAIETPLFAGPLNVNNPPVSLLPSGGFSDTGSDIKLKAIGNNFWIRGDLNGTLSGGPIFTIEFNLESIFPAYFAGHTMDLNGFGRMVHGSIAEVAYVYRSISAPNVMVLSRPDTSLQFSTGNLYSSFMVQGTLY